MKKFAAALLASIAGFLPETTLAFDIVTVELEEQEVTQLLQVEDEVTDRLDELNEKVDALNTMLEK